jgi:hypothetical protein
MDAIKSILKTLVVTACYFVLVPLLHEALAFVIPAASLTGKPNMPLLLAMVLVQVGLLVVAFNLIKDLLPTRSKWRKGLLFVAFFLVAVQIPSVFGIIAFDRHAWVWFNPEKVNNYWTLMIDVVAYVVAGVALGGLFPATAAPWFRRPRGLGLAMALGALLYPLSLCGLENLIMSALPVPSLVPHGVDSTWFNVILFGAFFLTGLSLPFVHAVTRELGGGSRIKRVLYTAGIFALCWVPVQNFMVVFGFPFLGGFAFSLVSLLPIALIVLVSDLALGE